MAAWTRTGKRGHGDAASSRAPCHAISTRRPHGPLASLRQKKKESGKSPVSVCSVEAATKNSNARSGNAYRHTALSIVEAVRISFLFFPIRISFLFYDRSDAMCFPVRKFQASDVSVLHVQEYLPTINRNICLRSTSKRTIGQSHC
jgi:hypothetical protein